MQNLIWTICICLTVTVTKPNMTVFKFCFCCFSLFILFIISLVSCSDPVAEEVAQCGLGPIALDIKPNGAYTAQLGQVVWQVSVQNKSMFGSWQHSCGGVILTKQAVLTSASCVDSVFPGMIRSETGIIDLPNGGFAKFPGEQKPGLAYTESVKVHPDFDKKTLANNLAVLRLGMPFDFEKSEGNISNICLPDGPAYEMESIAQALFLSGWGSGVRHGPLRSKLQVNKALLVDCPPDYHPMNPNEICVAQSTMEEEGEKEVSTLMDNNETATTTEFIPLDKGCEGDLGGPLYTDNQKSGSQLLAVASRTMGDHCSQDRPMIFLDVFPYLKWIAEASKPYYP